MNIFEQLEAAGLNSAAATLPGRVARMMSNGIECSAEDTLMLVERQTLLSIQCRMRLVKVSTLAELDEHGRLVNLLVQYTSESREWLLTQPLLRLHMMFEAVEATW